MPSIFVKSLRPRPMNVKGYRREILSQLRKEGTQLRKLFAQATRTWSPAVRFRTDVSVRGIRASVKVSTKDIRFISVDKGTRTRWAVMSSDFSPKSQVRSLSARRGRGGAVIRGKVAMSKRNIAPRPGIKPRMFSVEVRKIRRPIFFFQMRRAMKRAAKGTF